MRKILSSLMILLALAAALASQSFSARQTVSKELPARSVAAPAPVNMKTQNLAPAIQAVAQGVDLPTQIQGLEQQLLSLQAEMRQDGFPQALADDRTSETQRQMLLAKLSNLNNLQLQLTRLRLQQVDLETNGAL